ncbi:sensor histidine kinase [Microbacterium phosphatis]|uniref:sensor histidine kinase n=1 Tax=Microbacterium phosphatis TaxID=3140248 RepID=UPI003140B111
MSPDPRAPRVDPLRERSVILNQLLLGLVVLLTTLLLLATGLDVGMEALVVGVLGIFIASLLAVVVRWERLPVIAMLVVPALDAVSVAFLQVSHPHGGLVLLWVFPVLWISLTFGTGVTVLSVGGLIAVYLALFARDSAEFEVRSALLPLMLASLAVFGQVMARRQSAQRALLARQSHTLKDAFELARDQEALVSEVLQAIDFGVTRIGADGRIAVTNEAHERLHGAPDAPLFHPDGVTPVTAEDRPLARAARGEAFDDAEYWHGGLGSERRALQVSSRRLPDDRGGSMVVVSRDVTAERTALRARDDLVTSVSHELRTPLTSILGYLDLTLDDPALPASSRSGIEVAERNAQRLYALVDDLLTASAAGTAPVEPLRRAIIDLGSVAGQAVEAAAPRAAERRIVIDVSAIAPTPAFADAARVRQVVDNLLSNAIKYGHDDGRIWISCRPVGGRAELSVRDDGPGIPAAARPLVFERFFRADAVRRSGVHGSGLGLAISRDIVRAHGGDITLTSEVGSGTTFSVALPARGGADQEEAR